MKLYTFEPAPNPQRLALFMRYKGIDLDTEQVDLMQAQHLREEYRAIVPDMTVPALVLDDGNVLTEVVGICVYLEALYPEKPLLGTTALETALVFSWDHRLFNTLLVAVAEAFRNENKVFAGRALPGRVKVEQIPALAERGRYRLAETWKHMDEELAGRTWLAGNHFSLADIDMVACASFSGWIKGEPPESLHNLHDYLARARAELSLDQG